MSAIQAAAAATSATYRSFADATRSVLDLLERHMPGSAVFLAHLDRGQFIHRIVDVRGGGGLRAALQPGAAAGRRVLLAHVRGPRAAALRRRRRARRLQRPGDAGSVSPRARTSACRSSSRTARASARWPRSRGAATPSPLPTSSFSSCLRACSRPSSNGSPTHATCAGSTTCCEIRPREWARSAASPRRSPAATTPARRSARRPARSWTRRWRSCSSRRGATSPRRRWPACRCSR